MLIPVNAQLGGCLNYIELYLIPPESLSARRCSVYPQQASTTDVGYRIKAATSTAYFACIPRNRCGSKPWGHNCCLGTIAVGFDAPALSNSPGRPLLALFLIHKPRQSTGSLRAITCPA